MESGGDFLLRNSERQGTGPVAYRGQAPHSKPDRIGPAAPVHPTGFPAPLVFLLLREVSFAVTRVSFASESEKTCNVEGLRFSSAISSRTPRGATKCPPSPPLTFVLCCLTDAIECLPQLLQAENIVQQKDACNLFLITDRKLKQVFFEDMLAQGAISDADEVADERRQSPNTFGEPPQEKRMCVGTADRTAHHRPGEWSREWGPEPPGSSQDPTVPNGWGTTSEPPPVASATKSYVEEALPELESLSKLSR